MQVSYNLELINKEQRPLKTMASHINEEAKLLAQDEGPIASRLRSRFKSGDVKTYQTGNAQFFNIKIIICQML